MSISDLLENLQNKPRRTRIFILWAGTAIFMTFLFILWAWTMDLGIEKEQSVVPQMSGNEASLLEMEKEIPTLWQSLKAGVADLINSSEVEIGDTLPGAQEETPSENQETENGTLPAPAGSEENIPPSELP